IDNQIKYEFDYVLQLRYEIESKEKPEPLDQIALFQQMAQQGMIANEYVGHTENQKTPVTMQMMISKQEFEELKDRATSKNPIVFDDKNIPELPKRLSQFVNLYLKKTLQKKSEHATLHDIRISVNEAPATHAKEIVDIRQNILKLLVGDAALGLSYFKGLNAGLEASAKLFSYIAPILKNGGLKKNKNAFQSALLRYQEWFLDDFAPKKVKEVAQYSTWQINGAWNLMRSLRFSKVSSFIEYDHDPKYLIADHLNRQAQKEGVAIHLNPYPHRPYDPEIRIWELGYVPLDYSSKKIKKIFTDYATPYKAAPFQLTRELQKPLADTALSLIGLGKLVGGMVTLDPKTMEDGAASFARGALGLATFPAAWIIKPITKGISTAIFGYQKIEENTGIQELVQKGKNLLHKESDLSVEETIRIKHICFDLNRKFNTSIKKGQATDIKQMEEFRQINILRESTDKRQFEKYFSLFALSHPEPVSPLTQRKWISSKSIQ
ncbi:MAG TPA: hypothetical protein VHM20_03880, partial [Gammaproteobacteria bacterium]|nr:hypothetical protein [Gammaproteobacteria bacterium]